MDLSHTSRTFEAKAKNLARQDAGAIVIVVAILMVVFLGLAALVIDAGWLYGHDRDLQTLADSGALAGVQSLISAQGNSGTKRAAAASTAVTYIFDNADVSHVVKDNLYRDDVEYPLGPEPFEFGVVDDKSVTVDLREKHVPFFFARVLGETEGSVWAHAKAETKYITGVPTLFPVALQYMTPHHFHFIYTNTWDGKQFEYEAGNDDAGKESDDGVYSGGKTLEPDDDYYTPGLYKVIVRADPKVGVGDLEWNAGSWWVAPDENEPIQRVGVTRSIAGVDTVSDELSERIEIQVLTNSSVTANRIKLGGDLAKRDIARVEPGRYRGEFFVDPSDFGGNGFVDGHYEFTITIDDKSVRKQPLTIAQFTWFQRGEVLIYAKLTPELPSYSGYTGASGALSTVSVGGEVLVKTFHKNQPILLKPRFHGLGDRSGNAFWANIWGIGSSYPNLGQEMIGPQPGAKETWPKAPNPDIQTKEEPYGNKNMIIDVGELLETDNGASPGQWKDEILAVKGRIVIIPLIDPPILQGKSYMKINGFGAFLITEVSTSNKDALIIGEFVDWASPGLYSDAPSGPIYVMTAVLTQ